MPGRPVPIIERPTPLARHPKSRKLRPTYALVECSDGVVSWVRDVHSLATEEQSRRKYFLHLAPTAHLATIVRPPLQPAQLARCEPDSSALSIQEVCAIQLARWQQRAAASTHPHARNFPSDLQPADIRYARVVPVDEDLAVSHSEAKFAAAANGAREAEVPKTSRAGRAIRSDADEVERVALRLWYFLCPFYAPLSGRFMSLPELLAL